LLESGEVFVGDLAMNRPPLRFSPGLPIFADRPNAVTESWKMLLALGAKMVYPAHGKPFPSSIIARKINC
jgi:glyoxylase-like metal-dependent hydrolase (beta-lactamase superfamily II)